MNEKEKIESQATPENEKVKEKASATHIIKKAFRDFGNGKLELSDFLLLFPVVMVAFVAVSLIYSLSVQPAVNDADSYEAPTFGAEDGPTEMVDSSSSINFLNYLTTSVAGVDEDSFLEDINDAAKVLRAHMVDRDTTITVKYQTTESVDGLMSKIWKKALEHTGVPNEGDYLYYHCKGYKGSYSCLKKGDTYLITFTYNITYYTTKAQEDEVTAKIKKVMSSLNLKGKSEYQKTKAIYDYITKNVVYDYTSQGYTKFTAYGALINGTSVCQGYSNLFYRMCLEAGVDARIVRSKEINHAWNVSGVKSKFYQLDSTWDASRSKRTYFLCGATDFKDHKNSDDNFKVDPEFKADYPLSKTKYQAK